MTISDVEYERFVEQFDTVDGAEADAARGFLATLRRTPPIDVVMPVYESSEAFLRDAIDSVRRQIYENWTLCIWDDGSRAPHVARVLAEAERADPRIRVVRASENGGIARATNGAIAMGHGELVAFVDHDDVIPAHALLLVVHRALARPDANALYSDFDFLDARGIRKNPFFKPDYDPILHLGLNLVSSLTVYRRTVLEKAGGMRAEYPGSEDYDLALRIAESIPESSIVHIPHVLYHWRIVETSSSRARLSVAVDSARRAVREHCERVGLPASVEATPRSLIWNRVRPVPAALPRVTLAVWGRTEGGVERARALYREGTKHPGLVLSDVPPTELSSVAAFRNEVSRLATTELVAFVDARLVPRTSDWLSELAGHFSFGGCTVAGGRTLSPDGRVEQSGILLGAREPGMQRAFARAFHGAEESTVDYFGRDEMSRSAGAVAFGPIVVQRSAALATPFDEGLSDAPAVDVDFCLSVRSRGGRVVYCPSVALVSVAPPRSLDPESLAALAAKWGPMLDVDPWYNPNLSDTSPGFALTEAPRVAFPWRDDRPA